MPFIVLLKNIIATHQSKSIKHLKQMRKKIVILSIKILNQGLKKLNQFHFRLNQSLVIYLLQKIMA